MCSFADAVLARFARPPANNPRLLPSSPRIHGRSCATSVKALPFLTFLCLLSARRRSCPLHTAQQPTEFNTCVFKLEVKNPADPADMPDPMPTGTSYAAGPRRTMNVFRCVLPRRRHPVRRERQFADFGFWESMIWGFGVGGHADRFHAVGTAPMLGSKRSDNTAKPLELPY